VAGRAQGLSFAFFEIAAQIKSPGSDRAGAFAFLEMFYFTLAKMITSVYSANDSIRARPRISAS
jgi:hypothetical protein